MSLGAVAGLALGAALGTSVKKENEK